MPFVANADLCCSGVNPENSPNDAGASMASGFDGEKGVAWAGVIFSCFGSLGLLNRDCAVETAPRIDPTGPRKLAAGPKILLIDLNSPPAISLCSRDV